MWHTHLKKRLKQQQDHATHNNDSKRQHSNKLKKEEAAEAEADEVPTNNNNITTSSASSADAKSESVECDRSPASPPQCTSEISTVTNVSDTNMTMINEDNDNNTCMKVDSPGDFSEIMDENFWSDVLSSAENCEVVGNEFPSMDGGGDQLELHQLPLSPLSYETSNHVAFDNEMDFWYNVFTRAGESTPEIFLPDFFSN